MLNFESDIVSSMYPMAQVANMDFHLKDNIKGLEHMVIRVFKVTT